MDAYALVPGVTDYQVGTAVLVSGTAVVNQQQYLYCGMMLLLDPPFWAILAPFWPLSLGRGSAGWAAQREKSVGSRCGAPTRARARQKLLPTGASSL